MSELITYLNISSLDYVNALIIFGTFLLIAILFNFIAKNILKRITRLTKTDVDDKIADSIRPAVFYSILVSGTLNSLALFDFEVKTLFWVKGFSYSIVTIIWTVAIIRIMNVIINQVINRLFDVSGISRDMVPLISNISRVIIIIGALIAILSIWELDVTPVIASAGVASVIIALAAKDTASNFFGGISVFLDKPYRIGDYINLDSGERGEVVEIGMRSTRIKTRDDVLITIPNSIIANSKIINESAPYPNFRIRIPIGVAYGSDIDLVEKTLLDICEDNPNIIKAPEPRVRFREFGDSSLDFELLCWVTEPVVRGKTIHDLNKKIYKRFAELDIQIPFPQRDIHIKKG